MATTILIVEDEVAIADALLYMLRSAVCTCVHAATLLILDPGLSDDSGFDLRREFRRGDAAARDVPIFMLEVISDEVDHIVGLEPGADEQGFDATWRVSSLATDAQLRFPYGGAHTGATACAAGKTVNSSIPSIWQHYQNVR